MKKSSLSFFLMLFTTVPIYPLPNIDPLSFMVAVCSSGGAFYRWLNSSTNNIQQINQNITKAIEQLQPTNQDIEKIIEQNKPTDIVINDPIIPSPKDNPLTFKDFEKIQLSPADPNPISVPPSTPQQEPEPKQEQPENKQNIENLIKQQPVKAKEPKKEKLTQKTSTASPGEYFLETYVIEDYK